ncbi:uncharacterized protein Eint_040490 [Encephalitozoon intestinalis ATCC 50506]|uniref:HSF-type DNA-binding domain-containing protein n=1 Tax=Encephalitozoon intestinalis (strain ATCC 50506) TaxID=876142 RepID=E0S6K4_ENCIT|nr:uncharacterized protein Eint_040490 [Encephalitozoon intestinalis ATCC 50506]ADM11339.1 hypothetical protein Eint_040490 [Encephalitozoon intestinalis ATCC 50506]UTX45027.1 hypothetical protein GPK93_04g05640 [Encephalitozoon intestinalis]
MSIENKPFSFTYIIRNFHRIISKGKDGAAWSPCGREVIITDSAKFQRFLEKLSRKKKGSKLDYLKRNGFIRGKTMNQKSVFSHPWFVRGQKDLLKNFTLKNSFCWSQGIQMGSHGEPDDPLDSLKLGLFDLGRTLFNLRNSCLDLNSHIQLLFNMAKSKSCE